ncbi:MAG TPA: hypothetical protein P5137_16330, partial [Candidatus Brocadiia bacterium]|nr:hypothetical protein [Candidatus Brocadiia bacterium]
MPMWHCMMAGGLATLYALSLGADDLQVGVVNGALCLGIGGLALAPKTTGQGGKRWLMVTCWGLSGLVAVPLLALPTVREAWGVGAAMGLMAVCCFFYALFYTVGVGGWSPILRGLLPPEVAGRFVGVLRMAWQVVSLWAMVAVVVLLGPGGTAERYRFALALFLLAWFGRMLIMAWAPFQAAAAEPAAAPSWRRELADKGVLRRLAFTALCSALAMMSVPGLYVYLVRAAGYGHRRTLLVSAVGMFGGLATFPLWGRLAQRRGEGAVGQGAVFCTLAGLAMWLAPVAGWRGHAGAPAMWLAGLVFFLVRSGEEGLAVAFSRREVGPEGVDVAAPEGLTPLAQWGGAAVGALLGGAAMQMAGPGRYGGLSSYETLFMINAALLLGPLWLAAKMGGGGAAKAA